MKLYKILLLAAWATFFGACGTLQSGVGLNPFRHSVLRANLPDREPAPAYEVFQIESSRPRFEQRCVTEFRHAALNHCQRWLPRTENARDLPPPSCGAGRSDCRLALARTARTMIKQPQFTVAGRSFSQDCAGFVMASLAATGVNLDEMLPARIDGEGGVSRLHRMASQRGMLHRHKVPAIGDLVFFDNTHDRDGNGRADDPLTHMAIVERVDPDGTVTFVHHVSGGILRYKMNLFTPDTRRDPASGKVLNHNLRLGASGNERRLTGELFHDFATVLP